MVGPSLSTCIEGNCLSRCETRGYFLLSQPDIQHQFQLGDFGLCNRIVDAATFAGSRLYMPVEMV
jgi:hypothetical protein